MATLADLPKHRFTRVEAAFLYRCNVPDHPVNRPPGYCPGCGLVVTDEDLARFVDRAGEAPPSLGSDLYLNLVVLLRDGNGSTPGVTGVV